jgi:hypothetical protein
VSDIRDRIKQLITDSGAYQQGRQDERERLQHLIDFRIDELSAPCHAPSSCALNCKHVRQLLEHDPAHWFDQQRADMMDALYERSGRTCGLYTGCGMSLPMIWRPTSATRHTPSCWPVWCVPWMPPSR